LGPVRVRTGGGWVGIAADKQRLLLAVLLVHAGGRWKRTGLPMRFGAIGHRARQPTPLPHM